MRDEEFDRARLRWEETLRSVKDALHRLQAPLTDLRRDETERQTRQRSFEAAVEHLERGTSTLERAIGTLRARAVEAMGELRRVELDIRDVESEGRRLRESLVAALVNVERGVRLDAVNALLRAALDRHSERVTQRARADLRRAARTRVTNPMAAALLDRLLDAVPAAGAHEDNPHPFSDTYAVLTTALLAEDGEVRAIGAQAGRHQLRRLTEVEASLDAVDERLWRVAGGPDSEPRSPTPATPTRGSARTPRTIGRNTPSWFPSSSSSSSSSSSASSPAKDLRSGSEPRGFANVEALVHRLDAVVLPRLERSVAETERAAAALTAEAAATRAARAEAAAAMEGAATALETDTTEFHAWIGRARREWALLAEVAVLGDLGRAVEADDADEKENEQEEEEEKEEEVEEEASEAAVEAEAEVEAEGEREQEEGDEEERGKEVDERKADDRDW